MAGRWPLAKIPKPKPWNLGRKKMGSPLPQQKLMWVEESQGGWGGKCRLPGMQPPGFFHLWGEAPFTSRLILFNRGAFCPHLQLPP